MIRSVLAICASALAASTVYAGPQIGPLLQRESSQNCLFSVSSDTSAVVLELKFREARMQLDGKLASLSVKEVDCIKDCVAPGRRGVRVFELLGPGILASLTKTVECAKDAEVCAGLPEGMAELHVTTTAGETRITVWGSYCDL